MPDHSTPPSTNARHSRPAASMVVPLLVHPFQPPARAPAAAATVGGRVARLGGGQAAWPAADARRGNGDAARGRTVGGGCGAGTHGGSGADARA